MRKTTIAEACTLHARIGWQGLTKKEYLDEGDYYLVTGVDFDNGHIAFDSCHYVTKDRYDQDQHIQLHMDDILVTKDGTIGKVAIIDGPIEKPATLNSGVFVVRPKDKATLLPKYLMYVLQSNHFNSFIERIKVGCTIAHLNQEKFYQFEFPLPSVDDQEKIIKVFDTMFSVLYARKLELQKLDELIKARFVELFGDPSLNTKGYPIKSLPEIAEYWNGLTYKPEDVADDGTIVLRSSNIQNAQLDFEDTVRVTCSISEKKYVQDNDILMCSRNGSARLVGKVALIKGIEEPMSFGAFMMIIRSQYYPYLMTYFQMPAFRAQITTGATTTINQITGRMLDNVKLPVPEKTELDNYISFIEQVDKSKVEVQKALDETQKLFDSLMQEYFG